MSLSQSTAATRATVTAKKQMVEDMIEALMDPRVKDHLLTQIISPLVNERVEIAVDKKLEPILNQVSKITDDTKMVRSDTEKLSKDYAELVNQNKRLTSQMNEMTQYTRRDDLMIHGLQLNTYADVTSSLSAQSIDNGISSDATEEQVIKFFDEALKIKVGKADISVAHRVGQNRATNATSNSANRLYPPILIRFTNRKIRDLIYASRKMLKNTMPGTYINEHLSPINAAIFMKARTLVKQKTLISAFTTNGVVYVRDSTAPGAKSRKIQDINDLP